MRHAVPTLLLSVVVLLPFGATPAHAQCSCTPADLISGMTNPAGVDVDDTYAYVGAEDKTLRRVPKDGGAVDILTASPQAIGAVRVDAKNVFFATVSDRNLTGDGTLYAVPKIGGTPLLLGTGRINAIELDDNYVYWTDLNGGVFRTAKRGNGDQQQLKSSPFPLGLLLDGDTLYYADASAQIVVAIPKTGGSAGVTIASGQKFNNIAQDAANLYMTVLESPTVFKVSKSGGTATPLATLQGVGSAIRYVNGLLYVAIDDNFGPHGALVSIDPNSGAAVTVRSDRAAAHGLASDACAIYLTDWNNGGTLEKVCPGPPPHHRVAKH